MLDAVFAMRKKYRIRPKDPFSYRVFQPGGFVLGDTQQSSHSRDYLFGQYLAQHGLSLASSRLSFNAKKPQNSIAAAKIMQQQLKQLDLAELPIGIPFPLWSSDKFHGAAF
ncbi:hypothetical protein [Methylocucumis oryzae]|uniref:Uncharacterized protein n=1 Tax=Methylocucumis oryzae TaxID=1632867 RepID=A0A0F3IIL4_9GAMM|nr:hypothetical protein [Methylocucumis oryzae]KJV06403.1 hypothetical protein VZ94_11310 [Methylocucumis oryzae]